MTVESLICAVCGRPVALDEDHRRVRSTKKRMDDRDRPTDYYLHEQCARTVFEGWWSP
ncbi:hypothetical protein [Halorussus halobius]|uniref:hypothetical protein n=1 Tax=Halorussus halobius TaxID=1710537 RepID=UPI00143DB56E|nr:hypothetical protein [Halorussus halobius]